MKLRLLCLLVLLLFVFSACSSEAVKESENESKSASEPSGVSEKKDKYFECILTDETYEQQFTDVIPKENERIIIESNFRLENPMIVSSDGKKLYIENRSLNESALKTNMKLFSYYYYLSEGGGLDENDDIYPMSNHLDCRIEPCESLTVEGAGQIRIVFPKELRFKANVTEKIVISRDTVTVYGADKENPEFKDKEELFGRKVVFAE